MLDFGIFPPEINSGLMYTGPGSGPMLAAAAAWDGLAVELYSTALSYGLVISDLTSGWLGPSSISMAAAATPYVSWMSSTAGQAEQTGAQAKAAAAAYEAAFAMTVPPPVIAANRALLMSLIATNFFGQNTPAIMATEAQYTQMWAQDATAMYGYQGLAQAASVLSPWSAPAPMTSSAAGQAAAVGQAASTSAGTGAQTVAPLASAMSAQLSLFSTPLSSAVTTTPLSSGAAVPNALSGVVASTASTTSSSSSTLPLSSAFSLGSASTGLTSGTNSATSLASGAGSSASMGTLGASMLGSANSFMNSLSPAANMLGNQMQLFGSALSGGAGPGIGMFSTADMGNAGVSTGVGRAASLGMLSVPQSWTSAAPAFTQVGSALPGVTVSATPAVAPGGPGGMLGASPMLANAARNMGAPAPMTATPRFGFRPSFVQQPVYAG